MFKICFPTDHRNRAVVVVARCHFPIRQMSRETLDWMTPPPCPASTIELEEGARRPQHLRTGGRLFVALSPERQDR